MSPGFDDLGFATARNEDAANKALLTWQQRQYLPPSPLLGGISPPPPSHHRQQHEQRYQHSAPHVSSPLTLGGLSVSPTTLSSSPIPRMTGDAATDLAALREQEKQFEQHLRWWAEKNGRAAPL